MDISQISSWAVLIVGVGSLVVSGTLWNVIRAYKERIKQLEDDNRYCTELGVQHGKDIAAVQTELNLVRSIPLAETAKSLKNIEETNKNILKTLEASAVILSAEKHGSGLLVKTAEKELLVKNKEV